MQVPEGPEITITPAQTLPAQANLLPAQKSTAGAAEVGGLLEHFRNVGFGGFFVRRVVDVGVDKGLRDAFKNH